MNSVKEIEAAIERLADNELSELSRWFDDFLEESWDARMKADAEAGLMDALIEEARASRRTR